MPAWGFLLRPDRPADRRLRACARLGRRAGSPGDYEIVPNGVLIPPDADPAGREHTVVFAGRHEPRKGLQVLLRAWPEIHRRTGARLASAGADPLAVAAPPHPARRAPTTGIDVLGFLPQDELTDAAALDEGAGRAVARRRELRHGADARVRVRDARSSRPTSPATARSSTPETARLRAARRPATRSPTPSTSLLADEPRRVAMGAAARRARERALRVGRTSRGGSRDLRARRRRPATAAERVAHEPGSPRSRGTRGRAGSSCSRRSCSRSSRSGGAGPTGTPSTTRSTSSAGAGSSSASLLNLLSVLARSLAWRLTIDQALPPPQPTFGQVFSAFGIGLLGNAVLPARAGELARVAVLRPPPAARQGHERDAARDGLRAPAVRPVPGRAARRLGAADREDPALGGDEPRDPRRRRARAPRRRRARRRPPRARHDAARPAHRRGGSSRWPGRASPCCARRARPSLAIVFQCDRLADASCSPCGR